MKDILREKSFAFAVRIVKLNRYLTEKKREFVISNQLLRAGTNPGAMVREAAYAESADDFIHELAVARKEINERMYWLDLLFSAEILSEIEHHSAISDAEEIARLLTSSIKTKRSNKK